MKELGIYFVEEHPLGMPILGVYTSMNTKRQLCKYYILIYNRIPKIIKVFVLIHELTHHFDTIIFKRFFKIFMRNKGLRHKIYCVFRFEAKISSLICKKWIIKREKE